MQVVFHPLIVAGLMACATISSYAQPMMDMIPRGDAVQQGGPMGMRGKLDPAQMEAMRAKRHAELKARLKITPEQESAWDTFTTAMKPPTAAMGQMRQMHAEMDKLSTPERIDKMRALRSQHTAEMEKREEAIKTFYASLTPDQKKTFDDEHAHMAARRGQHRVPGAGNSSGNQPGGK